jgi:hypothetical protein
MFSKADLHKIFEEGRKLRRFTFLGQKPQKSGDADEDGKIYTGQW